MNIDPVHDVIGLSLDCLLDVPFYDLRIHEEGCVGIAAPVKSRVERAKADLRFGDCFEGLRVNDRDGRWEFAAGEHISAVGSNVAPVWILRDGNQSQYTGNFFGINYRHAIDFRELTISQRLLGQGNVYRAHGIAVALNHSFGRNRVLRVVHGDKNVAAVLAGAGDVRVADEADLELCLQGLCVEKSDQRTIFVGVGGIPGGVGLQFTVYKHVFAGRQVRRQAVRALNVRHQLDLRDLERAQIDFGNAVVGFVIDPEPMAVVATLCLAQHRMMCVTP